MEYFPPFLEARDQCKMTLGWSCDISIPHAEINASRKKVLDAWYPLLAVLKELNIDSISSTEIQLPKRFIGGRQQFTKLLKWLADDEHLKDPLKEGP